jgi:hypothetical protein
MNDLNAQLLVYCRLQLRWVKDNKGRMPAGEVLDLLSMIERLLAKASREEAKYPVELGANR